MVELSTPKNNSWFKDMDYTLFNGYVIAKDLKLPNPITRESKTGKSKSVHPEGSDYGRKVPPTGATQVVPKETPNSEGAANPDGPTGPKRAETERGQAVRKANKAYTIQ